MKSLLPPNRSQDGDVILRQPSKADLLRHRQLAADLVRDGVLLAEATIWRMPETASRAFTDPGLQYRPQCNTPLLSLV
jgi:hypothetical protein